MDLMTSEVRIEELTSVDDADRSDENERNKYLALINSLRRHSMEKTKR